MKFKILTLLSCAVVISFSGCSSQPGNDFELIDPICPTGETREYIITEDPEFARQIVMHNRLIDKTCR